MREEKKKVQARNKALDDLVKSNKLGSTLNYELINKEQIMKSKKEEKKEHKGKKDGKKPMKKGKC